MGQTANQRNKKACPRMTQMTQMRLNRGADRSAVTFRKKNRSKCFDVKFLRTGFGYFDFDIRLPRLASDKYVTLREESRMCGAKSNAASGSCRAPR
jgi:hypothetical protein